MQTFELRVVGRSISVASSDGHLVRTSVGVDRVHVLFDSEEWLSFPVVCSFRNGRKTVRQSVTMSSVVGTLDWYAECSCEIPFEVCRNVGPIYITIQGTDANGNHIITAKGAPLTVEEAGDVTMGDIPEDAPTVDQWNQAYSNAMTAINELSTAIESLGSMVTRTEASEIARSIATAIIVSELAIATRDSVGLVKVGDGLGITNDGLLSVINDQSMLATYERAGIVTPDGSTIVIGDDGLLHGASTYVLPAATDAKLGGIMPDEDSLSVSDVGVLSVTRLSEEDLIELTPLTTIESGDRVEY